MAYPAALDSFTTKTDGVTEVLAAHVNDLQAAVVNIETELGTDPAGSLTDVKTRLLKSISAAGLLNFAASSTLTISGGSITATQNWHTIDTESAAATDDLDTITAGADGQVLLLRLNNAARLVTVKHGTGNISTTTGLDFTLSLVSAFCLMVYDDNLDKWLAMPPAPADYKTNTVARLATVTGVNLNTTTKTTLYTVPTGYSCVINHVVVRAASTSLTTANYGFGFDAGGSDVITAATHTELTGSTLYTRLEAKAGAKLGAAADVFGVKCGTPQGGAATVTIDVYGTLY